MARGHKVVHRLSKLRERLDIPVCHRSLRSPVEFARTDSRASRIGLRASSGQGGGNVELAETHQVTVVAAAIVRDGRLLATRRVAGKYAGLWEFPGGKVEPGEDLHAALHRELHEELSVHVRLGERVGRWWPLDGGARMAVFLASLEPAGTVTLGADHSAMAWVGHEDALDLQWIGADRPIVSAVLERISAGDLTRG